MVMILCVTNPNDLQCKLSLEMRTAELDILGGEIHPEHLPESLQGTTHNYTHILLNL